MDHLKIQRRKIIRKQRENLESLAPAKQALKQKIKQRKTRRTMMNFNPLIETEPAK